MLSADAAHVSSPTRLHRVCQMTHFGSLITHVSRRHLRREEDIFSGNAGGADGVGAGLLVPVGFGRVDVSVAIPQRMEGYRFAFLDGAGAVSD